MQVKGETKGRFGAAMSLTIWSSILNCTTCPSVAGDAVCGSLWAQRCRSDFSLFTLVIIFNSTFTRQSTAEWLFKCIWQWTHPNSMFPLHFNHCTAHMPSNTNFTSLNYNTKYETARTTSNLYPWDDVYLLTRSETNAGGLVFSVPTVGVEPKVGVGVLISMKLVG